MKLSSGAGVDQPACAYLLDQIDVGKLLFLRVVKLHRIAWTHVARVRWLLAKISSSCALRPYNFRGKHIRHHTVVKDHVNLAVVLNVLVIRSQKTFVFEPRVACDFMSPGAHGLGSNRLAVLGHSFDLLQVEDRRQG